MRKGMLEYCIMLLLHKEPLCLCFMIHIIQKLKEAQLIVVEGTLYQLLTRLKMTTREVMNAGIYPRTSQEVL